jgi:hypothetical protein
VNPVDSSGRRIPVLPPTLSADDWYAHGTFRETFLLSFSTPSHNTTWRALGTMLMELKTAGSSPLFPFPAGIYIAHELRAVAGDLRHLQGVLLDAAEASGEGLTLERAKDAETWRLVKLARRVARRAKSVADALDVALEPGTAAKVT